MVKKLEIPRDPLSNTKSSLTRVKKDTKGLNSQGSQLTSWFFTYNNYTEACIPLIEKRFKEICSKYIFEREVGKCGTPHLQGMIFLKKRMRWTEFELMKEIHWMKPANETACVKYCQKDFLAGNTDHIYSMGINVVKNKNRPGIDNRRDITWPELNRPFQKWVINKIENQEFDAKCHWIHDNGKGQIGKTTIAKWLAFNYNAVYFNKGENKDICNSVLSEYQAGNPMNVFVVNLPRANKGKISWSAIEQILDGWIYSCKYEGGTCMFEPPHLFIFSNSRPDLIGDPSEDPLTVSRIKCYAINENYDLENDNFWDVEQF